MNQDQLKRFDAKWRRDHVTGCKLWTAAMHAGTPRFAIDGQNRPANRAAYQHVHGPIPDGLEAVRTCGEPRCVEVDHMQLMTASARSRATESSWGPALDHARRHPTARARAARSKNARVAIAARVAKQKERRRHAS